MKINSNTILVTKESSDFKELESLLVKIAAANNLTNVEEVSIVVDHSMSVVGFKTAAPVGTNGHDDPSSDDKSNETKVNHAGTDGTSGQSGSILENISQKNTTASIKTSAAGDDDNDVNLTNNKPTPVQSQKPNVGQVAGYGEEDYEAPKQSNYKPRTKAELMRQIHAGEWPVSPNTSGTSAPTSKSVIEDPASPVTKQTELAGKSDEANSSALAQGKVASSGNTMSAHGQAKSDSEFTKEGKEHGQSQLGINTILEKKSKTKDDYTPKTKDFEFSKGSEDLIPEYIKNKNKVIYTPTTRMAFTKVAPNTYRDKFASKLWTLKEKVGEDGGKTIYLVAIETDDTIKE